MQEPLALVVEREIVSIASTEQHGPGTHKMLGHNDLLPQWTQIHPTLKQHANILIHP